MIWYGVHEDFVYKLPKGTYRGPRFGKEVLSVMLELFIQQLELKCSGQLEFRVANSMARSTAF